MNLIIKFLKSGAGFISHPTHSRTMGILIVFVLVAAVSLTVYVAQQQQQLKQRAADYCADTSIIECPPEIEMEISAGNICASPNFKCKIDNYIYECK